jgi:membrane fusion protein, heavy metal efflux system
MERIARRKPPKAAKRLAPTIFFIQNNSNIMQKYIIALMAIMTLAACGTSAVENETENTDAHNMVSLSAEEISAISATVGSIEQKTLSSTVQINGVVAILNEDKALIVSQMGGIVKTINKHLGSSVKAGEVIATVSNPDFISLQEEYLSLRTQSGGADTIAALYNPQYISLRESYNSLQPKIAFAELELKRQKELNAGNAGSLKNLQQAENELNTLRISENSLRSQLNITAKHAQKNVDIKRAALENKLALIGIDAKQLTYQNMQSTLPLRSPISGSISQINVRIGEAIDMTNPVAEVISTQNLCVELNVYENQVHLFAPQQIIDFHTLPNAQTQYQAEVSYIGTNLHPTQKTAKIQARIRSEKAQLLEGMNVVAAVNSPPAMYSAVPATAIAHIDDKDYIFVLRSQNEQESQFEQVAVQKILSAPPYVAIQLPANIDPTQTKIATTQAFFILGKMTNKGEE